MTVQGRYHQVVLMRVTDRSTFGRFVAEASPVAGRYERAERLLAPQQVIGDGVPEATLCNVVSYRSPEAYERLQAEPVFEALLPLRDASTELVSVFGYPEDEDAGPDDEGGLADRRYLVEFVRFAAGGAAAYREYADAARAFMAPFGYHVERTIRVERVSTGFPFRPDLVRVAYFERPEGMRRMEQDPRHAEFEGDRYAAAAAQSLWVVATALTGLPVDA